MQPDIECDHVVTHLVRVGWRSERYWFGLMMDPILSYFIARCDSPPTGQGGTGSPKELNAAERHRRRNGKPGTGGWVAGTSACALQPDNVIGMSRAGDAEIRQRARQEGRIGVTLDADFHSLPATAGEAAPRVMRIRQQGPYAGSLATLLRQIWPGIRDALPAGAMVTITQRSVRVRPLPVIRPS